MNRPIHKPALLSAAMLLALSVSAPGFALDSSAPGNAVRGANPAAPSTQKIPSSGTNNSRTNGSVGNPSNNPNNSNDSGAIGNGTNNESGAINGQGGAGTGSSTGGTLEDQRRASGEAMERERTGE